MATYFISKHLSDLLGLRMRVSCYIGDKAGKFIAQGRSAGKTCWFLFYVVVTLQKQHCDIFRMLIHRLNILMCCNSLCLSCQSYQLLYLLPSPNAATEMAKQRFGVCGCQRKEECSCYTC